MNEQVDIELKREITKTFLKTVTAFANYQNGQIIFGVDDYGQVRGINDVEEARLQIENMINDSISPVPRFSLQTKEIKGKKILVLEVEKGKDSPYFYQNKTYKRADTSTVEVDRYELRRLSLLGLNLDYEQIDSDSSDLEFFKLEKSLQETTGIEKINLDILKTLGLYSKDGRYNMAAELLADKNDMQFCGIDMIRFGKDTSQLLFRETINKQSVLYQYERAIKLFEQYYQYEEIKGYKRIIKQLIPKEAFREALANALVHRDWEARSLIQLSMDDNKVEISSPGGLPEGITETEYLNANISTLRNPILAGVFYRLNIIEKFGTGIGRIIKEYDNSFTKPIFNITENRIFIQLPVINNEKMKLSKAEESVYLLIKEKTELYRVEVDEELGFNKAKTVRTINNLLKRGLIQKKGSGPKTTYTIK